MTANRLGPTAALALTFGLVPDACALVLGGGRPRASDCYVAWEGVTASGGVTVTCQDGEPCDQDGRKDGACTFDVAICVDQTDPAGICTPQPVTAITPSPNNTNVTVTPATPIIFDLPDGGPPWSGSACGAFTSIPVFLRRDSRGVERPSKRVKLRMVATAEGTPRRDIDTLVLRCLPGAEVCPANPAGGPSQLTLAVPEGGVGTDLDIGWTGISHNFPVTGSAQLRLCLSGCDTHRHPVCQGEGATGANTLNGEIFGAPLPLFAAGTPLCVVNRFDPDPGTVDFTSNTETGEASGTLRLRSEVYVTTFDKRLCPQCSGGSLGEGGDLPGGPERRPALSRGRDIPAGTRGASCGSAAPCRRCLPGTRSDIPSPRPSSSRASCVCL